MSTAAEKRLTLSQATWIRIIAAMWWVHQNDYFGWNAYPHSDAELICHGITAIILALSFVCPTNSESKV